MPAAEWVAAGRTRCARGGRRYSLSAGAWVAPATRTRRRAPTVAPGVALAAVLGLLAVPVLGVVAVAVLGLLVVLILGLLLGVVAVRVFVAVLGVSGEGSSLAAGESIKRHTASGCRHCTTPSLLHVSVECSQMTKWTHPVVPRDMLVEPITPGRRAYGVQLMCVATGAVCLVHPPDVAHCTQRRVPLQVAGILNR